MARPTAWAAYAACALALARPWGRAVPCRLLLGAAWAAAAVLTAYGGLLVAVGASVLAGVLRPAGAVDRTALWWHVLLWDLWFLVWGLLLGMAAWHHGRASLDREAGHQRPRVAQAADRRPRRSM